MSRRFLMALCLGLYLGSGLAAPETAMYEKLKTYCFGRYLVDVPVQAEMIASGSEYLGERIEIERIPYPDFQRKVEARIVKLKTGGPDDLALEREIKVGDQGTILVSSEDVFGTRSYNLDTFKFDLGWAFTTSSSVIRNVDRWIDRLTAYLNTLRYRTEGDIPQEPGFCVPNGFIADRENTRGYEKASLQFKLKNNPDVYIYIQSALQFGKPGPSLLERAKAGKGLLDLFRNLKTVRSGQLTVNGVQGEELLIQGLSDDQTGPAHVFQWEARGDTDNPDKPSLQLNMETGMGVFGVTGVSSMETKELVRLFDAIVKTIRIRPTAPPAPKTEAPPPRLNIVASGTACPRAGRWRCVETGQTLVLAEGQPMPEARYERPATGWLDRLRGAPLKFSHMGPGTWEWAGND